jgi:hypothetical protein
VNLTFTAARNNAEVPRMFQVDIGQGGLRVLVQVVYELQCGFYGVVRGTGLVTGKKRQSASRTVCILHNHDANHFVISEIDASQVFRGEVFTVV